MLPLPHLTVCNHIRFRLNQMVQKQNSVALKAIANQSTGMPRFKGRRPQIHNTIAKITTPFIIVLMLCINL